MACGYSPLDLPEFEWIVFVMRKTLLLIAALGALAAPIEAAAQPARDSEAALRGVQQGDILPLNVIRERIRINGAILIGVDLIANRVYRLRFMRGANVIMVDVDARTGRPIGCMGC